MYRSALHDAEEQLRRRRGHDVAPEVQVRAVRSALGPAEIAVEAPRVAAHRRAQPQRVVHLIGVARRDRVADRRDGRVVASPSDRRNPRASDRRRRRVGRRRIGQHGGLAALEQREPQQRELLEGVPGRAVANAQRGVEPARGLVRDEPTRPQAAARGALDGGERLRHLVGSPRFDHADGIDQAERTGGRAQVVEPDLDHRRTDRREGTRIGVHGGRWARRGARLHLRP